MSDVKVELGVTLYDFAGENDPPTREEIIRYLKENPEYWDEIDITII